MPSVVTLFSAFLSDERLPLVFVAPEETQRMLKTSLNTLFSDLFSLQDILLVCMKMN